MSEAWSDAVPALTVKTVAVADPGSALTDVVAGKDGFSWSHDGQGIVGWGRAAQLDVSGPNRFEAAMTWWSEVVRRSTVHDAVGLRGSGLVTFGSFAFSDARYALGAPGRSVLVVPDIVVGNRGGCWWITTVGVGHRKPILPAALDIVVTTGPCRVKIVGGSLTSAQWEAVVADAVRHIAAVDGNRAAGDDASRTTRSTVRKVVLARDLTALTDQPVDVRRLISRLAKRYPSCYTYAVDGAVGATPELLVRLEDHVATSLVLAGTARRTGARERDEESARILARSPKNLREHRYAVTSVVQTLTKHCTSLAVPAAPFVMPLPGLMHLASEITGVVEDGSTSLSLAADLHPTAAVCGTPGGAAASLIAEIEGMDRGRYAGPVGWMNASGDGEWGIALRGGQLDPYDPRRVRLFAGCGIVAGSHPADELAETVMKFAPMREALSG